VVGRLLLCSEAALLQFAEGTKAHLCIVERNSPTPVRRRFSVTQEDLGRVIPGGSFPVVRGQEMDWVEARRIFLPFHVPLMFRPTSCCQLRYAIYLIS